MSDSLVTTRSTVARVLPWGVAVGSAFAALAAMSGLQDHDYFWHLATGRLIALEGLPRTDPFSFTYGGDWILHEWLGELLLHLGREALGTAGLIAVWSALLAVVLIVIGIGVGRRGATPVAVVAALSVAGIAMIPYASLRPVMLSLVLFAFLVLILLEVADGHMWPMLVLPLLFALWANTHGFWSLGLGILAIFIGASWLGWTPVKLERIKLTVVGVACAAATLLTPYGVDNLLYPLRYVDSGDWGLANINEWQSPDFHEPAHWPLLAIVLLMALLRGRSSHRWLELCAWLAIAGSLYALRLTPVAAVLCGFSIALALSHGRRSHSPPRGAWALEWGLAGVMAIGSTYVLLRASEADATVNPELFPIAAVDLLAERDPTGRIFADYAWGGYVIHRLNDEGATVFVDGRNDMYPEMVLDDYFTIRDARPEAAALLDSYEATAILLRPEALLVRPDASPPGWCRALEIETAVLLLRGPCEPASSVRQNLKDADGTALKGRLRGQPVSAVALGVNRRATVP